MSSVRMSEGCNPLVVSVRLVLALERCDVGAADGRRPDTTR